MTDQRPIERILDRWFDDGPTQAPDRVFDAVADRIERQPQRPAWRLYGRLSDMNTGLKLAAAIAAVAIFAVAGYNLLPGPSVGGPPATPSPSPTATIAPSPTPTAAPSTGAVLPPWYTTSESPSGQGILPAGSYMTRSFTPGFTFSVPEGWVNDFESDGFYGLFPDTPANKAEFARSLQVPTPRLLDLGGLEERLDVADAEAATGWIASRGRHLMVIC